MSKSYWTTTTLEDICQPGDGLQTGPFGSQLHASEYTSDGVPVIMPKDMVNQRVSTATIARIPESRAENLKRHRLKVGDIVFGRRGDIGRCVLITCKEEGWICGSGSLRVRLNETVSSRYLIYYLSQPEVVYWLESNAVGQTMLNLSAGILASLPVEFPSLSEQRKIADLLSIWDEAIDLTEQLIAAKQKRKQALMQRLLTGQVRFPEFIQSFHREEVPGLGSMPCDWPISKQGQVAKFFNGRAYKKTEWETIGTPVIRLQNLTGRGEEYYYSRLELPEHQYCNKGDLLYMWSATFGPHIWQGDKAIFHYHIWKVECSENLYKEFLYFMLAHLTEKWMSNTNGMGLLHITKETMESLPIPVPSLAEQRKIASVLGASDQELSLLQQKLAALRQQKKGLMQQLLTGKIRVKV